MAEACGLRSQAMSPENPWLKGDAPRGDGYDRRFAALEASGQSVHGEADFVSYLGPPSVLDAGCGTGRVAIELAARGVDVVGIDLDEQMLATARAKAPELAWVHGDLAAPDLDLGRRFAVVVAAGNVMIFLTPGTERDAVANLARHLEPGGLLVAGFQLGAGRLALARYDDFAAAAGLTLAERWATWDRQPFVAGGDYAVSVHRRA
jgi:SAM-dependent methyltransferase